ncbi:DNA repair protein RAD5 [Colletotrichum orbiculare MAFF 240422]|uniref:DNA repair protein RAD5 n=1 Tax=Colletotrichum orbiculare (strain 104-T / ATCC 96160 / CBS 514.97 / LARS 414 / MAFF 240422) TaxID=1213857 RepID=A0A484G391_COLOR|nr:DNA repair protein RAD5 [Colletotrichum orbiculare MAFF 240422]
MQQEHQASDRWKLPLTPAKRHLEVPSNEDLSIPDDEASPKRSCTPEKLDLRGPTEDWGALTDCDDVIDGESEKDSFTEGDATKSSSLQVSGTDEIPYDTCFGMILVDNVRIHSDRENKKPSKKAAKEVNLEPCSSTIIMRDKVSSKYCGLLGHETARAISSLLDEHNPFLSATLTSSNVLSILVYGPQATGKDVGAFLSGHGLFLQQPDFYDESATYRNPQWLIRPGTEFKAEESVQNVASDTKKSISSNEKSKVGEILDSATGPAEYKKTAISNMVVTKLMTHQIKALSMMMEKESGVLRNAEFPSLWVEKPEPDTDSIRYYNTVTNAPLSRRPKLCLGGLLADDMGLGKTLTILALIASSVDERYCDTSRKTRPTLVIAPLSTLTHWQDQIKTHFKEESIRSAIYHGPSRHGLVGLGEDYDIILTNYDTVRVDSTTVKSDVISRVEWHRIVLDEAHVIRNRSSKLFEAVCNLEARHRCSDGENPSGGKGIDKLLAASEPSPPSSYRLSSKVKALIRNLQQDIAHSKSETDLPTKSVVFSLWTKMLDLVGKALTQAGIDYRRVDGSMSLSQRHDALTTFRKSQSCYVLLASIGSAGVGLDLTMASRLHIIEPGWNPMLERQALQRVHRLGQKKKVVSTCYVVAGDDSVEKYIRRIQDKKVRIIADSMDQSASGTHASIQALVEEFRNACSV